MPKISKGKCGFCGKVFPKNQIAKHFQQCSKNNLVDNQSTKKDIFHLLVEGMYCPQYWLHLVIPANLTLEVLDNYLREIWLECCGHLSEFTIEDKSYSSYPDEYMESEEMKNYKLKDVLSPGLSFSYVYDFGSSTHLKIKVIAEFKGSPSGKDVQLLAKNLLPDTVCDFCGKKQAVQICTECLYSREGKGWLCQDCLKKHKCDEEMFLPVVNSPRTGVCGYTG